MVALCVACWPFVDMLYGSLLAIDLFIDSGVVALATALFLFQFICIFPLVVEMPPIASSDASSSCRSPRGEQH